MSTISITYTPLVDVDHRICFRKVGDTDYCCMIDGTANVLATPKVFTFTIGATPCASVPVPDTESCSNEEYEGYIQPACYTEDDPTGRVAWSFPFVITPLCRAWEIECLNGGVTEFTITDPGFGYDVSLSPIAGVIITGTGTLAAASLVIGTGSVKNIAITTGGTGYTPGTYLGVDILEAAVAIGGKATIVVDGDGTIVVVTVTTPSTGYTDAGATLDLSGLGAGSLFTYVIDTDDQEVKSITVTAAGSGYEAYPTATLPAPTLGSPVQATANITGLENCPTFSNNDCMGTLDTIDQMPITTTVTICQVTTPTPGTEFNVTEIGACCGCNTYQLITGADPGDGSLPATVWYTDCSRNLVELPMGWDLDTTVCAITDSVFIYNPDNVFATSTSIAVCS